MDWAGRLPVLNEIVRTEGALPPPHFLPFTFSPPPLSVESSQSFSELSLFVAAEKK